MQSSIKRALWHFKNGDIVIFPTDTLYAVGCILNNKKAVNRLYKIKQRSKEKPSLILVKDFFQAEEYAYINDDAKKFLKKVWPGPVTIVAKAKSTVPVTIRGAGGTVAIRVPNFPKLTILISKIGEPVLAPSANFQGDEAPTNSKQIDSRLIPLVDYALYLEDLDKKFKPGGVPSTLIDITKKPYKVIREGTSKINFK